jgi:HD-GYP domain-containing protein (c-di-GMP phosphodiesterase class II)/pSer/pThr/pTyr-binding forkhead associated (FHA) protein
MMQRIRLFGSSPQIENREWQAVDVLRIGREQHLEMRLDDSSVSRSHAEVIFLEPIGWFVRDLGSTNGTYLNGVRVGREYRKIRELDLLQVGNLVLRVLSMERVVNPVSASPGDTVRVEASVHQTWDEAFDVVAGHVARESSSDTHELGWLKSGREFHQNNSVDDLLRDALGKAVCMLKARRGALAWVDGRTGEFTLGAFVGDAKGPSPQQLYSRTLAERCLSHGESLLIYDVRNDAVLKGKDTALGGRRRSVLCALVRSPQKRLGIMHLDRDEQDPLFSLVDLHLADAFAASLAGCIEGARHFLEKRRCWCLQTVVSLAQTIELRNPCTAGHARRVTRYALLLADALNVHPSLRRQIKLGSYLHDIGKIGVWDSVLRKNGPLSPAELQHIQSHAVGGAAILEALPDLAPILPIVRNHHERWDGQGYPDGLAGEKIPLTARIVALADSFDAMTSDRPYRPGLSIDEAFDQVQRCGGRQFDPKCSQAFLGIKDRLSKIYQAGKTKRTAHGKPRPNRAPSALATECVLV